jgi:hypothetical protein
MVRTNGKVPQVDAQSAKLTEIQPFPVTHPVVQETFSLGIDLFRDSVGF